jgi:hypothetical protein
MGGLTVYLVREEAVSKDGRRDNGVYCHQKSINITRLRANGRIQSPEIDILSYNRLLMPKWMPIIGNRIFRKSMVAKHMQVKDQYAVEAEFFRSYTSL